MKDEKLKDLMRDIYDLNTCMIIYKTQKQMEEIATYLHDNVEDDDVYVEISLNEWSKLEDESGVKYKEQFYNIMQKLMNELSIFTKKNVVSEYKKDVTKTLIPLLEKIQDDETYNNCFIVIKNFERINDIFPNRPDKDKKQFFPLDQLLKLSVKNNDVDVDILVNTYVVLLSNISIDQVEIYKEHKNENIQSDWPYQEINAGEDED